MDQMQPMTQMSSGDDDGDDDDGDDDDDDDDGDDDDGNDPCDLRRHMPIHTSTSRQRKRRSLLRN
jgi:hypothetical protein